MFHSDRRFSAIRYATTIALLLVAFVASPAALVFSAAVEYSHVSVALAVTALCATLAVANWKRQSDLTLPSIMIRRESAQ